MDLNAFAYGVHQVAVEHGWWENKPSDGTILALIHSEWSEALEEYRNNRGIAYCAKNCGVSALECVNHCRFENCTQKPEGIAVEIADGIIRILDYFGSVGHEMRIPDLKTLLGMSMIVPDEVPEMICALHVYTADGTLEGLELAVVLGLKAIEKLGMNAENVLVMKNGFNKKRPYRHGGKIC